MLGKALGFIPADSACSEAVARARSRVDDPEGGIRLRERYEDLHAVPTVNNLALVIWALLRHPDDDSTARGDVVAAGLDTDCNGATVSALRALQGKPIPVHWTRRWQGRLGVSLAGMSEMELPELTRRTVAVTQVLEAT